MTKTLIINLDAFKFDYLERTTFLKELAASRRHGRLQTILGYTGIEGTITTGKSPEEHGIWVEFVYSPATSPFKWLRPLSFLEGTLLDKPLRQAATLFFDGVRWMRGQSYLTRVPAVPFGRIGQFDVSLARDWSVPGALGVPTIFDIFRRQGIRFVYFDWPIRADNRGLRLDWVTANNDQAKVATLCRHLDKADVFWLRLWDLDHVSHAHGTKSPETDRVIRAVDDLCRLMVEKAGGRGRVNFLFWADHGMVDVRETVDIASLVRDLDIPFFLDSAMARFWVPDETRRQDLGRRLDGLKGRILSPEDRQRYRLRFPDNRYGDVVFLADPGVLIFPNHYQRDRLPKAMHGYVPGHPDQQGLYLSSRTGPREDCGMADMFSEILALTTERGN